MGSKTITPFNVFQALRKADTGRQLEKVFRGICYALNEWCKYGSSNTTINHVQRRLRYGDDEPDVGKMNMFEFDKFINVICRVWTEIFKATGLNELDEIEKLPREQLEKIVRFKPPGDEVPGTHGPGTARPRRVEIGCDPERCFGKGRSCTRG